jgi:hypothetical protein
MSTQKTNSSSAKNGDCVTGLESSVFKRCPARGKDVRCEKVVDFFSGVDTAIRGDLPESVICVGYNYVFA